jgi:hypothetical protein
LWRRLVEEGFVADTQEALREKSFQAYQAQQIYTMAQKELMPEGWNPLDPMKSVKQEKGSEKFVNFQRAKNPVPENVLSQSFLRYAYGVKKETFRRWIGKGSKFPDRIPMNKGKNIIDDYEFAEMYFTPKKLFMEYEMAQFLLTPEGRVASKEEKTTQRNFLKEHFKQLPQDILDVYLKGCRERLAHHGVIAEAIVNTLNDNRRTMPLHTRKVTFTHGCRWSLIKGDGNWNSKHPRGHTRMF